jgi:hypothetical protein
LVAVLAGERVAHPDVAVTIDVQPVRKHEQAFADALGGTAVARSIKCTGGRFEPSHVFTPHRSIAQISLCGPISTPRWTPRRLSGSTPQLRTARLIRVREIVPWRDGACAKGTRAGQSDQDDGR